RCTQNRPTSAELTGHRSLRYTLTPIPSALSSRGTTPIERRHSGRRPMKRTQRTTLVLIALAGLLLATPAVAADNNIGTWKLNLAKTTQSPGAPPKSHTVKIAAWGEDGIKYTSEGVSAEGKPTHATFQARYDGKDYPFDGRPGHTVAYKRIDANTSQAT